MRVSAQPNINSQQYLDSPIILPSLDKQIKIVEHIKKLRDKIITLRKCVQTTRIEALTEFENEIFE